MMEDYIGHHGCNDTALHDPCLGMTSSPFFHDPGAQPLPNEAQYAPIIDSLTQSLAPTSPVDTVEVSTDICIHYPAAGVPHAPLPELVQCVMGTATPPDAVRAVGEVVLVDRFQQHRHCALDDRVLARRCPDRALLPVLLLAPDACPGPCLGASAAQTLMQVVEVLVEVFGILLRRHPIDPRGPCLACVAVCLPQKVDSDQMSQGCQDALRIAGGLCCHALELWCDGW